MFLCFDSKKKARTFRQSYSTTHQQQNHFSLKMMDKGEPLRRSRRAASLTAQVLWNLQIEEDAKPSDMVPLAKISRKPSSSKETATVYVQANKSSRGRKRDISDKTQTSKSPHDSFEVDFASKKQRLSAEYSDKISSANLPSYAETLRTNGKLTASVSPVVKSQPIRPKMPATKDSVAHRNPILLLPVSLQPSENSGQTIPGNVAGLSLVTVQAPLDIFNCFDFNKSSLDNQNAHKEWNTTSCKTKGVHDTLNKFDFKNNSSRLANISTQHGFSYRGFNKPQTIQVGHAAQVEPLNLKMGETTVPSSKLTSHVRPLSPVNPDPTRIPIVKHETLVEQQPKSPPSPIALPNPSDVFSRKPQTMQHRTSPAIAHPSTSYGTLATEKKRPTKSPSPDYSCSSPEVDDVQEPRRNCKYQHIDLRHKAANPPAPVEYEESVEVQRRLLAEIENTRKNKAKAKTKLTVKRSKSTGKKSKKNRLSSSSKSSTSQSLKESNNGWKWVGKPYSSSVFSLASGKYVQRCCYPGMTRHNGTSTSLVLVRDCIVVQPSDENEKSYVGKVTALWEKPRTKEMMLSLVWFYRPEHTGDPKLANVSEDELFSSRHQDEISVACIEDRCHVFTYQQFCRAQANLHRDGMWEQHDIRNIVPAAERSNPSSLSVSEVPRLEPSEMFFSRQFYDAAQKKVKTKLPHPTSLRQENRHRNSVS